MSFLILSVFISSVVLGNTEETAYTESGSKVILNEDGTWQYAEKESGVEGISFRGSAWGSSKEQIKASEADINHYDIDDERGLVFADKVDGLDVYVAYIFSEDKLARGRYIVNEKHLNKNDYISDFRSLEKLLKEKYGKPKEEETFWKNDLYKDNYESWGLAISKGDLVMVSTWDSDGAELTHIITGDNFKIEHAVEYSYTPYSEAESNKNKQKSIKKL